MPLRRRVSRRLRAVLRVALSYYVCNGLSVALGLLLISGAAQYWLGSLAGAAAATGVIVTAPPDLAAPRRGKFYQMLPAALLGLPLFLAVQMLYGTPGRLGLLLVPASFLAFLAMAWGKRGIPVAVAVMFSMVFSMALPAPEGRHDVIDRGLYFGLGVGLYLLWSVLANLALNGLYRRQVLADNLLSLAALMHTQARQFAPRPGCSSSQPGAPSESPDACHGQLLAEQAALTDQLQATSDIVLESPRTARRQQLAGMLMAALEIRDQLLTSGLDLELLHADPDRRKALGHMQRLLKAMSTDVRRIADALLQGRTAPAVVDRRPALATIELHATETDMGAASTAMLARGLARRLTHVNEELRHLSALARQEQAPRLSEVRANWQVFVSPAAWSLRPFLSLWHWDAPPLRHAIRAALAVAAGYLIAVITPWGAHDYWILLTIVVVLRGSVSQTLERRNTRVAGTLLGCVLAMALLRLHLDALALLAVLTLAQAAAHGFAVRRYFVTAVAATVLGLLQAHMLNSGLSPRFALFERLADTLVGSAIAWVFCYVVPSWERTQIPALVARTLSAVNGHARCSLGLGELRTVDTAPELEWRLARREAYDSLSALVQATQRSLAEPRAVQPPLVALERLQTHSYQLLAQLSSIKSMLLLRRDGIDAQQVEVPLRESLAAIHQLLALPLRAPLSPGGLASPLHQHPQPIPNAQATALRLPDPFERDVSPWLLRRLDLVHHLSQQVHDDAHRVLAELSRGEPGSVKDAARWSGGAPGPHAATPPAPPSARPCAAAHPAPPQKRPPPTPPAPPSNRN